MTTTELLERGIGHNCLSDAYDLGKADGVEECINLIKMCCPPEEICSFGLLVCGLEKLKELKNDSRKI